MYPKTEKRFAFSDSREPSRFVLMPISWPRSSTKFSNICDFALGRYRSIAEEPSGPELLAEGTVDAYSQENQICLDSRQVYFDFSLPIHRQEKRLLELDIGYCLDSLMVTTQLPSKREQTSLCLPNLVQRFEAELKVTLTQTLIVCVKMTHSFLRSTVTQILQHFQDL